MADFNSKMEYLKKKLLLRNCSCRDLIWLINILPTIGGFSLNKEKIIVTFWILHTILSFYVYVYATIVYQMYYANGIMDGINCFLNFAIFVLIVNSSVWTFSKRSHLKTILELITKNDDLAGENSEFLYKLQAYLRRIKLVLMIYYTLHFVNDVCVFVPIRIINFADGTIGTCFGLEPVKAIPNRMACGIIVATQELVAIVAVVSYDVSLILLLAHTTAMYNILYEDLMSLNDLNANSTDRVSKRLKNYIVRHAFLLKTVEKVQAIYSATIGFGFGINAMSLSLFLFLPLKLWLDFAPFIYYTVSLFFLYCFQGQRLTTATERLEMAVYCCGWEKFSCNNRRLVLFMLKQSQKPVVLLAAHIVPIRIHTFANTMQLIYKFFTIFKV